MSTTLVELGPIKRCDVICKDINEKIHSVRFELTRDSIPLELESNALDRSATNAVEKSS